MTSRLPNRGAVLSAFVALTLPLAASAQTMGYGAVGSAGDAAGDSASSADAPAAKGGDRGKDARGPRGRGRMEVTPYIEAAQIVTADLSPGNEVLTYSVLAAGLDATIAGRNNAASASVRYEHRFGWGKAEDSDFVSGIARGYATVVPGVRIEAGALAARTSIDQSGTGALSQIADGNAVTHTYSVYGGPSVKTHAGDVAIDASYLIGYTKIDADNGAASAPLQADVFDESTAQMANVHAGVKAGDVLPVGIGAGAGYYREDISNLDQRVEDFHARADVAVPLTNTVQLVGGIGYEDVEISGRDAVRNGAGLPVVGSDGRYVVDESSPRILAYDVEGLIWDAGVIWRPSRRTALEAHVGRRYGSTSYYGSFAYAPTSRSALNISVYDNVAGFGGQLNRALAGLPSDFQATRNPLTGNIGGCVASLEGGNCLSGVLGSVRSATFRARGVMATYGVDLGRLQTGIGAGYDRRKFIAAPGTVLASANGVVDENYWLAAYLNGRIDQRSSFSTNVYANWFQTGAGFVGGDATLVGATAAYYRSLTNRLSATAALGLDGISRADPLEDVWSASALVGVRYSF